MNEDNQILVSKPSKTLANVITRDKIENIIVRIEGKIVKNEARLNIPKKF